jgi:hypothetical protein
VRLVALQERRRMRRPGQQLPLHLHGGLRGQELRGGPRPLQPQPVQERRALPGERAGGRVLLSLPARLAGQKLQHARRHHQQQQL